MGHRLKFDLLKLLARVLEVVIENGDEVRRDLEPGCDEVRSVGFVIEIDAPEINLTRVRIVNHVARAEVLRIARLADRADVDDVAFRAVELAIFVRQLLDESASSKCIAARCRWPTTSIWKKLVRERLGFPVRN